MVTEVTYDVSYIGMRSLIEKLLVAAQQEGGGQIAHWREPLTLRLSGGAICSKNSLQREEVVIVGANAFKIQSTATSSKACRCSVFLWQVESATVLPNFFCLLLAIHRHTMHSGSCACWAAAKASTVGEGGVGMMTSRVPVYDSPADDVLEEVTVGSVHRRVCRCGHGEEAFSYY